MCPNINCVYTYTILCSNDIPQGIINTNGSNKCKFMPIINNKGMLIKSAQYLSIILLANNIEQI